MQSRIVPAWQKHRSAFNHDWLKNQFMPALSKFLNILDGKIEDPDFERSFITSTLTKWELHREEALFIAKGFEDGMSPKHLFNYLPLSRCSTQTRQWLGELLHALWLTRYPIKSWIAETHQAVEDTDTSYRLLMKELKGDLDSQSAQALKPYNELFIRFREQCQHLARTMEKFPREVKVM